MGPGGRPRLKRVALLVDAPGMVDESREQILREKSRSYRSGELIFDVGAAEDCLFIVVGGCIELSRPHTRLKPETRRPGDFFGEAAALSGARRSERAIAIEPSQLIPVSAEELRTMFRESPEIGWRIMQKMSDRHEAFHGLTQAGERTAGALLSEAILHFAEGDETSGLRVQEPLKRLAETAGLSMKRAYRAVHDLIDRKQVRLEEDVLVILEAEPLRVAAGSSWVQADSEASQDCLAEGAAV